MKKTQKKRVMHRVMNNIHKKGPLEEKTNVLYRNDKNGQN